MNKTVIMAVGVIIALVTMVFIKESREDLSYKTLNYDAVILAYGDSLTFGFGASADSSYPSVMEKKTGIRVINGGGKR